MAGQQRRARGERTAEARGVEQHVPWPALRKAAKERFGIQQFRSAQREVLAAVFAGRDTLAIMPTGAGKSLTYQLPALFLPKPVLVVSPLIALMEDQQQKAVEAEIAVDKMDSTLSASSERSADEHILAGTSQLLYVTPERLQKPEFLDVVKQRGVSLFVVDEAHTVPQWGHDFRPAFLALKEARAALGNPPLLALTATATEDVTREILDLLRAREPVVINAGSERSNLYLAVHATVNNDAKIDRLTRMICQTEGSGIVYTASVRSANELHERFTEAGLQVGRYHGRMPARDRERVQHDFMHDRYRVMIATKAFGLGIDKPDIRFVYHFEFPESLETYYQEAGRAGRDGKPSEAVLLFRLEDRRIQAFFTHGRYPTEENLRAVADALAGGDALTAKQIVERSGVTQRKVEVILYLLRELKQLRRRRGGLALADPRQWTDAEVAHALQMYADRASADRDRLQEMMHYAESVACRKQTIRAYFGEDEGEPCGNCDNCRNHAAVQREAVTLNQPQQQQGLTRIETISGTIVTTAPETLPRPEKDPFHAGDSVRHKSFGTGVVQDVHGDTLLVRFSKGGSRKVKAGFVQLAAVKQVAG